MFTDNWFTYCDVSLLLFISWVIWNNKNVY